MPVLDILEHQDLVIKIVFPTDSSAAPSTTTANHQTGLRVPVRPSPAPPVSASKLSQQQSNVPPAPQPPNVYSNSFEQEPYTVTSAVYGNLPPPVHSPPPDALYNNLPGVPSTLYDEPPDEDNQEQPLYGNLESHSEINLRPQQFMTSDQNYANNSSTIIEESLTDSSSESPNKSSQPSKVSTASTSESGNISSSGNISGGNGGNISGGNISGKSGNISGRNGDMMSELNATLGNMWLSRVGNGAASQLTEAYNLRFGNGAASQLPEASNLRFGNGAASQLPEDSNLRFGNGAASQLPEDSNLRFGNGAASQLPEASNLRFGNGTASQLPEASNLGSPVTSSASTPPSATSSSPQKNFKLQSSSSLLSRYGSNLNSGDSIPSSADTSPVDNPFSRPFIPSESSNSSIQTQVTKKVSNITPTLMQELEKNLGRDQASANTFSGVHSYTKMPDPFCKSKTEIPVSSRDGFLVQTSKPFLSMSSALPASSASSATQLTVSNPVVLRATASVSPSRLYASSSLLQESNTCQNPSTSCRNPSTSSTSCRNPSTSSTSCRNPSTSSTSCRNPSTSSTSNSTPFMLNDSSFTRESASRSQSSTPVPTVSRYTVSLPSATSLREVKNGPSAAFSSASSTLQQSSAVFSDLDVESSSKTLGLEAKPDIDTRKYFPKNTAHVRPIVQPSTTLPPVVQAAVIPAPSGLFPPSISYNSQVHPGSASFQTDYNLLGNQTSNSYNITGSLSANSTGTYNLSTTLTTSSAGALPLTAQEMDEFAAPPRSTFAPQPSTQQQQIPAQQSPVMQQLQQIQQQHQQQYGHPLSTQQLKVRLMQMQHQNLLQKQQEQYQLQQQNLQQIQQLRQQQLLQQQHQQQQAAIAAAAVAVSSSAAAAAPIASTVVLSPQLTVNYNQVRDYSSHSS